MEKLSDTSKPDNNNNNNPEWYCPQTGIYTSKHPTVSLPTDPFLDVVSFIFSHKHNGVTAFIDSFSGFSIPYSDLFPLVNSMASGLQNMGLKQGDVVLLLLPNSIYFPILFLGVLYLGAVVTTMNPLSTSLEIEKQISNCNACIAFSVLEKAAKLQSLGIPVVSVPENVTSLKANKAFDAFYMLLYGNVDLCLRPIIRQEDTAAILYSSGTTGSSKGVVLTHRNFISMVELFVRFEASQYDYSSSKNVFLAVLPMFHVYGLSLFVMGLLSLGSSIVVMRKFDANEMVKAIDMHEVTHFPVVPPMLQVLTKKAKSVYGKSLKSLKQVSCGAAPLFGKTIQDFVETLPYVDFIQGYGMTESTAVGTRGFNTKNFQKYSSIGLLAPNIEAKVMDWVTGCFLPPGNSGELLIRGPAVMKEYLNNGEATASTIDKDGWLHTGDIVYIDHDGYLHIVDRLKEIIKYKGFQCHRQRVRGNTCGICGQEARKYADTGRYHQLRSRAGCTA
ncbi:4-coumarate--CoA ligase-like 6 isoform X2 [Ricinus communis]|uniref:4-coumarate--CoA ligase-like 6 isoform X2 n=1 Tax=Ricinus communis TaxID=3988 RepID=UPI00201AE051|nr:4-coumarate--CoA ligase-like 6 isoform X2 [Ricinus communis]